MGPGGGKRDVRLLEDRPPVVVRINGEGRTPAPAPAAPPSCCDDEDDEEEEEEDGMDVVEEDRVGEGGGREIATVRGVRREEDESLARGSLGERGGGRGELRDIGGGSGALEVDEIGGGRLRDIAIREGRR
jgi:hypothetical protein